MTVQSTPTLRCAIYTRKSTEEGLEQEFNSLDAQYDACAAYVASQRHEGWRLVAQRFDDGGVSGGSLDRPALQDLLAEVEAGRIGMIVVYKVDRLTRSLADFTRLIERLEARGCSFVSVTQAFNTANAMGRLTLNVLLSFAQFEREVTAERIRDKITASKRKGLWMGGTVPLGYDRHPDPRQATLVVNAVEAQTVRQVFDLYEACGSLRALAEEVARLDLRSKRRVGKDGRATGGHPLKRSQLYYLLTNPMYIGRVRHRRESYPGLHSAIIAEAQFERVQALLRRDAARKRGQGRGVDPGAALMGRLRDETGDLLTPSHTQKGARRYRYYVSNHLTRGERDPRGWRIAARALERGLAAAIAAHLERLVTEQRLLVEPDLSRAAELRSTMADLELLGETRREVRLLGLIGRGRFGDAAITLTLEAEILAALFAVEPERLSPAALTLAAPLLPTRRAVGPRAVIGGIKRAPNPRLVEALVTAHRWALAVRAGEEIGQLAQRDGVSASYLHSRMQLAFLAPSLQAEILTGCQPEEMTVQSLIRPEVPLDWAAQAERYGVRAEG